MPTLRILEPCDTSIADSVEVVIPDFGPKRLIVANCARETFVKVPAWVCQDRIDRLQPDHVDPVVLLLRIV